MPAGSPGYTPMLIEDFDDTTMADLAGTLPPPDFTADEERELEGWTLWSAAQ